MKVIECNPSPSLPSRKPAGRFHKRLDGNGCDYVSKSGHEFHAFDKDGKSVETLDGYRMISNNPTKPTNNILQCFKQYATEAIRNALKRVFESYVKERFISVDGNCYDLAGSDPTDGVTVNNDNGTAHSWYDLNDDETKCKHYGEGISCIFQKRKVILEKYLSLLNATMPTMASQPPPLNSPPSSPNNRSTTQPTIQTPPTTPMHGGTLSTVHQTPQQQRTDALLDKFATLSLQNHARNQADIQGAIQAGREATEMAGQALREGRENTQNVTHLNYKQCQDQIILSNTVNEVVALKHEMEILKEVENGRRGGTQQKIDTFKGIVSKASTSLGKSFIIIIVPIWSMSYLTSTSCS